ncbi:MAG: PAS domain-containing protein [Acidobacteria bacterium]|nr:PAS domain-containing protein [Acidobacteriota bacterium]
MKDFGDILSWGQSLNPRLVRLAGFVSAALVAYGDWRIGQTVSLGPLYLVPIVLLAFAGGRGELAILSVTCALCRTTFASQVSQVDEVIRFVLALAAYSGFGLFTHEILRNQRLIREHLDERNRQQKIRQQLEEHLHALAESSPAAIFTLDEGGRVLSANQATARLFGLEDDGALTGICVSELLPVLAGALRVSPRTGEFRSAVQCQGRRLSGELFGAQTWFSTYQAGQGRCLAAIAVDSSEEVRDREEQNLRHLLANNRIVAGAVSHEIRNMCGAISMIYSTLASKEEFGSEKDFQSLGVLIEGLSRIAAMDLAAKAQPVLVRVDLRDTLEQLRILVEPAWLEMGGRVTFDVEPGLPPVLADGLGVMQALLNLTQNSLRAVEQIPEPTLSIRARGKGLEVEILITDSGPGIADPSHLFEPFQQASEHVGLGLYVARALLRSYGGDLRFHPLPQGCQFSVHLQAAE